MSLIDKDKTVEAIATYLFVNDAIRGPEPRRIADYLVFAQSMLTDVPETDVTRCKDCVHWQLLTSPFGLCVWNEDNKRQMEETGFCSCGVKR